VELPEVQPVLLLLKDTLAGSIVVIGNAPSALLSLCEMVKQGIRPAVIIGAPVGFVNAAESKGTIAHDGCSFHLY